MSDPIGVVITGASGRMGQMLINTVAQSDRLKLVGAIERSGHPWLGQDIGLSMGMAEIGVTVEEDPLPSFSKANCAQLALENEGSGSSSTVTPISAIPIDRPISCPSQGCPERSIAPTNLSRSDWATVLISI